MNNLLRFIVMTLIVLLCGCSAPALVVNLKANHALNPDITNHPLPVEVVVYQLRDAQTFTQATFDELWRDDRATLGPSLLTRDEVNVIPGGKTQITIKRDNEVAYVGVMAIFRNPDAGHWRVIKKLGHKMPLHNTKIYIDLINYSIKFKS